MSFADAFADTPRAPRPKAKRRPPGTFIPQTEDGIQISIIKRLEAHGCYVAHVPNGGMRNARVGAYMKRIGTKAGFPDLVVIGQGRICLLEVKKINEGLTREQPEVHAALARRGVRVAVVYDQDEAFTACQAAGLIK